MNNEEKMGKIKKDLSQKIKAEIIRLYLSGEKQAKIAKEIGETRQYVHWIVSEFFKKNNLKKEGQNDKIFLEKNKKKSG